jgi:hypothetical protein
VTVLLRPAADATIAMIAIIRNDQDGRAIISYIRQVRRFVQQ